MTTTFYCINTVTRQLCCNCNYEVPPLHQQDARPQVPLHHPESRQDDHRYHVHVQSKIHNIQTGNALTNGAKDDSETLDTSGWCSSGVFERVVCVVAESKARPGSTHGTISLPLPLPPRPPHLAAVAAALASSSSLGGQLEERVENVICIA